MINALRAFIRLLGRLLLALRYRVRVTGSTGRPGHAAGTLVLPNHPGYIDPALVMTHLGDGLNLRPMVFEDTYRNPVLYPLMKLIGALEIPKLNQHSRDARRQTEDMVNRVVEGLARGENFLIYPSGRLQREGTEIIGAASAVAEILQRAPEARVVLVRTRGVWGSRFSFAQTGQLPALNTCLGRSALDLLTNGIAFMPRREVSLHAEVIDRRELPGLQRDQLNPWLEAWYNEDNDATPVWVPYHFLSRQRSFEFPLRAEADLAAAANVPEATRQAVREILEAKLNRPLDPAEATTNSTLDALGLDSLDRMEVAMEIERHFGFQSEEVPDTLGGLDLLAHGALSSASAEPKPAPESWRKDRRPDQPATVHGTTIPEAFVHAALQRPKGIAAADDISGALSYEKLLVGSLLMARRLREVEGQAVGVLLPASVAADLVFLALHFAGKTPVLLNWTTGQANLESALTTMNVRHVITSRAVADRLGLELNAASFLYLEDLRAAISKLSALRQLLRLRVFGSRGLGRAHCPAAEDIAAVLFTSGSEKAPKAVPLTHANILANVRAGADALGLRTGDTMLGFLPPFHSFGLSGNMILALTTGMRIVHHPDPTDARGLARKIKAYRPTVLFSTPTFLGYILNAAKPGNLASLRLAVTGAEACPPSVAEAMTTHAPDALLTEGYGITECSPVVAVGRPGEVKPGTIGRPLDNVATCIVDSDTREPLPAGATGMLLVSGPSIFGGYLGYDGEQPFHEHDGRTWYVTGDLVSQEADGTLTFRGRLKRFLKAGGEMISLPALEAPFAAAYPPSEDGPRAAVEGIELPDGGRRIALFITEELTLRDANRLLNDHGFHGIMRLDEVRRVARIPVLGTGKIDHKVLRAELQTDTAASAAPTS